MPPLLVRLIRYFLIGFGALTLVSAVVNIVATYSLLGPIEEDSLGVTRGELASWYILSSLLGVAMVLAGVFWRRKK